MQKKIIREIPTGTRKLLLVLLAISFLLNIILCGNFMVLGQSLNTSWYRLTSEYVTLIQGSKLSIKDKSSISLEEKNLKIFQRTLFDMALLPRGNKIISGPTLGRFESLLEYQFQVLEKMDKEITSKGHISSQTENMYAKTYQAWDNIRESFKKSLKEVNPFSPFFMERQWQEIFESASKAKDSVKLQSLSQESVSG